MDWYQLHEPECVPSPSLLLYPHRIRKNIEQSIAIAGTVDRLRPHVKTHKMPAVVALHQSFGIQKMKCATIAEAEMLAECGVKDVLFAYQPVGPNQARLLQLIEKYPKTHFSCLVDSDEIARQLSVCCGDAQCILPLWVDIDNGNHRTGIAPSEGAEELIVLISELSHVEFAGLHVYDGHLAKSEEEQRAREADKAFDQVLVLVERLGACGITVPTIVAGGSPTFPSHALRSTVELSPGTYSLWDMGYSTRCSELPFIVAAVLLARVVSKPGANRLCLDLGHKAVSADRPLEERVHFLNAPDAQIVDQKEEHLVVRLEDTSRFALGDVLYGVPGHVCPSVALHEEALVIGEDGSVIDQWQVKARKRRLSI